MIEFGKRILPIEICQILNWRFPKNSKFENHNFRILSFAFCAFHSKPAPTSHISVAVPAYRHGTIVSAALRGRIELPMSGRTCDRCSCSRRALTNGLRSRSEIRASLGRLSARHAVGGSPLSMDIGTYGTTADPYTFEIDEEIRGHHTYLIGQTGTGKSTLIRNMIAQDMLAGRGLALIDPHGDLSQDVVLDIPIGRDDDLIYFKPADLASPIAYNPLSGIAPDKRAYVAGTIVGAFVAIFGETAVADRSRQVLRNSLLALMQQPEASLLSLVRLLTDSEYRAGIVSKLRDPLVHAYWLGQFAEYDDRKRDDVVSPILNKLDAFLSYPEVRNVLAQTSNRIDFERIISQRKIMIADLSGLSESSDRLLGALIVSGIWAAARSAQRRTPFCLYLDEFEHFSTASTVAILSEARKYQLSLTLGHQFWGQVSDDIKDAVFGNVGTLVAFRTGAIDAPLVGKQFDISERQLRDLPNHSAYVRPLPPSNAILIRTNPPPPPVRKSPDNLIANSRNHFASRRSDVEDRIARLLTRL
jgi:Type IV secretion-system coupling protein DNA-binding domain